MSLFQKSKTKLDVSSCIVKIANHFSVDPKKIFCVQHHISCIRPSCKNDSTQTKKEKIDDIQSLQELKDYLKEVT